MLRTLAVAAVLLLGFTTKQTSHKEETDLEHLRTDGLLVPWCLGGEAVSIFFADVTPRGDRFRPETAKLVGSLEFGNATSFAYTRDSRQILVMTTDGKLVRWTLSGGRAVRPVSESLSASRFSVNSAGTRALCVGSDRKSLRLIDVERGSDIRTFQDAMASHVQTFALSPDGRRVALVRRDQSVRVCDAASGDELKTLIEPKANQGGAMAWSPDGKLLAIHGWDSTVRILDAATGETAGTFAEMGRLPLFLGFSPDSSTLVLVTQEARIRMYDRTGRELRTLDEVLGGCRQVAFSPDGFVMAASDVGGKVRMWDARTWKRLRDLDAGVVRHLAFSPDGRHLALGMNDGTVKLWGGSGPVVSPPKLEPPRAGAPGFLGITGDVEDEGDAGALITTVMPGTAAEKAGLQAGDRIVRVGAALTETFDALREVITSHREGDEIEITFKRGDAEKKVKVKLGARPKDE